jgi:HSP20 family protein
MTEIDDAIGEVTNLYRAVTGRDVPNVEGIYAPIPAEKDPLTHVQEQLDRLAGMLEEPARVAANATSPMHGTAWMPPLAVWEGATEVLFAFDLPGVSREQLDLNVQGNVLIVAGQRPLPVTNGLTLRTSERPMGPFRRLVPLLPGFKAEELSARLVDGVLEIRIPREAANGGVQRRIPVS